MEFAKQAQGVTVERALGLGGGKGKNKTKIAMKNKTKKREKKKKRSTALVTNSAPRASIHV